MTFLIILNQIKLLKPMAALINLLIVSCNIIKFIIKIITITNFQNSDSYTDFLFFITNETAPKRFKIKFSF